MAGGVGEGDPGGRLASADLPGPLQSLKSLWLVSGENADVVYVRATVTAATAQDATRLNAMAGGLMMLATAASGDATVQSLVQATHISVSGADINLDWSWPLARMGELRAADPEGARRRRRWGEGRHKLKIKVDVEGETGPTTRK